MIKTSLGRELRYWTYMTSISIESAEPYDVNFCFPLPTAIENERLKLVPFIPSKHGQLFADNAKKYPEIFQYLPFGPFEDTDDFMTNHFEARIQKDPGYVMLAVFDKTKVILGNPDEDSDSFAGLFGLINSSAAHLVTEIGCIMILPPFQRTHVASNAVGLLLHYTLDLPALGGLGLRRVVWQANSANVKSIRLAERMGFKLEGILRWDRDGYISPREGDPRAECPGRHTALLSLCWDEWESGGREHADRIIARKQ
ncbi:acyl-CoA N-acyltransferase [Cyathus striatus]|nr:acyl-CoA N-acyltransferase [Cyathus striatus]